MHPQALNLTLGPGGGLVVALIVERDVGAAAGKLQRYRLADASRASRNQRDLAFERCLWLHSTYHR